jgi:BirA family biotin operon repressor/biotin-[acetyl-CoA-carboxylase] ligase
MTDDDSYWRLSVNDIRQLERETFVRQIEHHRALHSTNDRAMTRTAVPSHNLPLLVTTDQQTAGRGRGGHQWWSAAGALTFSLVLDCNQDAAPPGWPQLALTAGIAVCEALLQIAPGLETSLKWPNDVYVRSRKIGGILIEAPPPAVQRVVVGIGLNVNNRLADAPQELQAIATSLFDIVGYPLRLATVLGTLLNQLAKHLTLLKNDPAEIHRRWDSFCMLTGRTVALMAGGRKTVGVCHGINGSGAILLRTAEGVESFSSGEVISW